jgi:hypothetical protein
MNVRLSSSNNLAAWKDYRTFRRNLLAISGLEQRLAADLHEAEGRARGGKASSLDMAFLRQSCRALAETAADARGGLERLAFSIPADRQRDSRALMAAAAAHLPDLDAGSVAAAIAHFDANGGPAGLLNAIADHLGDREARYHAAARLFGATGDASAILADVKARVFPDRPGEAPAEAADELVRQIGVATDRAAQALRAGVAYPVALAERHVLAEQLFHRDPLGAVRLGFSAGPWRDPEPILCFIFGLGWMLCAVAFVAAISSHNVEDDEEEEDEE